MILIFVSALTPSLSPSITTSSPLPLLPSFTMSLCPFVSVGGHGSSKGGHGSGGHGSGGFGGSGGGHVVSHITSNSIGGGSGYGAPPKHQTYEEPPKQTGYYYYYYPIQIEEDKKAEKGFMDKVRINYRGPYN